MASDPKLATVIEALSRAHRACKEGSREAQSGTIGERATFVQALMAKAQDSYQSWANWEAINDQLGTGKPASKAIGWLELGAVGDVRKALIRDAILGAFRLSDPVKDDRLTLCKVASWLDDEAVRTQLSGRAWAIDLGHRTSVVDAAAARNADRVDRIRRLVPPNWKGPFPKDRELLDLRSLLRPTRNHLAHALDSEMGDLPTIDEMRRFISLTLDLATESAFLWIGSAVPGDHFREFHQKQAKKFWVQAFKAPIEAFETDMRARRAAGNED